MTVNSIPVDIYKADVVLVQSTWEDFVNFIEETYEISCEDLNLSGVSGYSTSIQTVEKQAFLMWVDDSLSSDYKLLVFHHESIHIANAILSHRGVYVTREDDEALAYLSEFIFSEILYRFFVVKENKKLDTGSKFSYINREEAEKYEII